jgi:hypothetical protein
MLHYKLYYNFSKIFYIQIKVYGILSYHQHLILFLELFAIALLQIPLYDICKWRWKVATNQTKYVFLCLKKFQFPFDVCLFVKYIVLISVQCLFVKSTVLIGI